MLSDVVENPEKYMKLLASDLKFALDNDPDFVEETRLAAIEDISSGSSPLLARLFAGGEMKEILYSASWRAAVEEYQCILAQAGEWQPSDWEMDGKIPSDEIVFDVIPK